MCTTANTPPNKMCTTANTPPNKMQEVTMKQKIIALATFLIALLVVTGLFVALVMGATLQELLTPLLVLLVGYLIIFLRQEKGG